MPLIFSLYLDKLKIKTMNLSSIAFDLYQTNIIAGIKFRALYSTLNDEQRKMYEKTINDEIAKIREKLEATLTPQQADAIIQELCKS